MKKVIFAIAALAAMILTAGASYSWY